MQHDMAEPRPSAIGWPISVSGRRGDRRAESVSTAVRPSDHFGEQHPVVCNASISSSE